MSVSGTTNTRAFNDILQNIRSKTDEKTKRGREFEVLTKRFLETEPGYKNQFKKTWLWSSWPKRTTGDIGVDIICEKYDGTYTAVQCKFYDENNTINDHDVRGLLSSIETIEKECNVKISQKIFAHTSDDITKTAKKKLVSVHCSIIDRSKFEIANVDWSKYPDSFTRLHKPFTLRTHQQTALKDVINGFKNNNRGQLIMACGTGKTLTALHIAQKMYGKGSLILYVVPSISLIQQAMSDWASNSTVPVNFMAVCSDDTVSNDEGNITDLECPVSTKPDILRDHLKSIHKDRMNVIFSTYQSLKVIRSVKDKRFDLVLCDEAHRTTGVEDDSSFRVIHKDENIQAKKRLYMTATPKVYSDIVQKKTKVTYSMDNEKIYGPIFHTLSFKSAVEQNILSDFKVKVVIVPESVVNAKFQQAIVDQDNTIPLDERTLLTGVWHGLQYPDDDDNKPNLLQRVIAFTNRIDRSEMFAGEITDPDDRDRSFKNIVNDFKELKKTNNTVEVKHMDGTMSANKRRKLLNELKDSDQDPNTCKIVSNSRCLSEGVDVPALDGIIFLNPRKSRVDVVQSVGRVMRKSKGKEYGYVILPVAIPDGVDYDKSLNNNKTYKVVWQVLNALRSHDESLSIEINKLILDKNAESNGTPRISISILDENFTGEPLAQFFEHIKSKLVKKVGDIDYYDKFGESAGSISRIIKAQIEDKINNNEKTKQEIEEFHKDLQELINDSITFENTVKTISQHLVMSPIFKELFSGDFISNNQISKAFNNIVKKIGLNDKLKELDEFYDTAKQEISGITTDTARQEFIKKIYDNFFKGAYPEETKQHGIVYTPIIIVDFIINSIQDVLVSEFGKDFASNSVKVLDPFTGTGSFIARLISSGYLDSNLTKKYKHDLYANELILLAYYIATVNIETTFTNHQRQHKQLEFEGINHTDTLRQNPRYRVDAKHRSYVPPLFGHFKQAHERIQSQRWSHLHVIMGNPPYSRKKRDMKYPELDQRIKDTYVKDQSKVNDTIYDSYIRAIRWASDRIGESGVIGFVTNSSFIHTGTTSGVRASILKEFTDIYCFDLRGDATTKGEKRRKEKGNVFGSGSKTPITITIFVKNPNKKQHTIHYKDIGDYLSREDKLKTIHDYTSIQGIKDWQIIKPDKHDDWFSHRSIEFEKYTVIGSKKQKSKETSNTVFKLYSSGVKTARDVWAYNSSKDTLSENMKNTITYWNKQKLKDPNLESKIDKTKAQWTSDIVKKLERNKPKFNENNIRTSLYRPFFKQYLYFDKTYNQNISQIPQIFPKENSENLVICIPDKGKEGMFSTFITNMIPDLHIIESSQCFPLYRYDHDNRIDNITDYILSQCQLYYDDNSITKECIFYYAYGLLHHEGYKNKFAIDLSKELPRIPLAPDFEAFCTAGKQLAELHLNYETCDEYPLKPKAKFGKPEKLSFSKIKKDGKSIDDKTNLKIYVKENQNETKLKIHGIEVFDLPEIKYTVNGRTPIEWMIDQYKCTVKRDSGIVNDPMKDITEEDITSMIKRLTYIGVESDKIINELSKLDFEPEDSKSSEPVGVDQIVRSYDALSYLNEELRRVQRNNNIDISTKEKYIENIKSVIDQAKKLSTTYNPEKTIKVPIKFHILYCGSLLESIQLREDGTWQAVTISDDKRRTSK